MQITVARLQGQRARRARRRAAAAGAGRACRGGLAARRGAARAGLPEFEALRDVGRDIKDHTLAHLDLYLEAFETKATEAGGHVHCAPTAEDARAHHRARSAASAGATHRHQGQVDDLGGDRPQRRISKATASRWSRPTSAST